MSCLAREDDGSRIQRDDVDSYWSTVMIVAWFHVADKAFTPDIVKYIHQHQVLYPHARILLLFNTVHNMLWRPDWVQMKDLQPAVWAIDESLDSFDSIANTTVGDAESKHREPTVLFHIFSNGGAHLAVQLAQAYRGNMKMSSPASQVTGTRQLPVSALIFDSCPGHARYETAGRTTLSFLPKTAHVARAFAMPVVYLLLGGVFCCHVLGLVEHIVVKLWRELNNPDGPFLFKACTPSSEPGQATINLTSGEVVLTRKVIPRTYICSQQDDMIFSEDVFEHAAIARHGSGLSDDAAKDTIRIEEFVGSMHVNHVSVDKERYWRVVKDNLERI